MITTELLAAALALVVAVGAGTVVHELSHAVVLRAAGVSFELQWLPRTDDTAPLHASIAGGLASVELRTIPADLSPWRLRTAALMPFLLATPFAFVVLGIVPDPFQTGNSILSAALIGWLACALPSPQDFSMFWYAGRIISRGVDE